MQKSCKLAFFDFDGTITTRDSFAFFMYYAAPGRFLAALILFAPKLFLFWGKRYSRQQLKEDFLAFLFRGKSQEELARLCRFFTEKKLASIVRPQAAEAVRRHQDKGDTVVVVTASPRILIEPWGQEMGIPVLGTELEFDQQGLFSGKIMGKNCRGAEKVRRIKANYDLSRHLVVAVYGDSDGDKEMFELAAPEGRFFKPFRVS